MSPQRRTALVSVAAAVVLIAVKLASGLTSGSLGLVAEAHEAVDRDTNGLDVLREVLFHQRTGEAVDACGNGGMSGEHRSRPGRLNRFIKGQVAILNKLVARADVCSFVIARLLAAFPPAQQAQVAAMVSESLHGVVCQRLVPGVDGRRPCCRRSPVPLRPASPSRCC